MSSLLTAIIAYLAWDAVWARDEIAALHQQIQASRDAAELADQETRKSLDLAHNLNAGRINRLTDELYQEGYRPADIRRILGEFQAWYELRRIFEQSFDQRLREFATWQYSVNEKLKKLH